MPQKRRKLSFISVMVNLLILASIAAVVLSPFLFIPIYRGSSEILTITVKDKDAVKFGDDSGNYLVWSEAGECFHVEDTWSFFSFDASDRYGRLNEGQTYKVKVAGWRVQFFSWYRNIIEIEEIE